MSNKVTQIKQCKQVGGMMSATFDHDVVKTTCDFKWTGPKLTREEWHMVLSFFRWTNDTFHSESQVRLYVHPQHGWKAWAFPQKARTGMSAQELPENDQTHEQRAQFGDGWEYFGTVHHHCTSGAFQSGTDKANEQDTDGLHITVGALDKELYDIHCRLYIVAGGKGFNLGGLDMSEFWDIGDELLALPPHIRALLPSNCADALARKQMCVPAPADTKFPEQWLTNIIEPEVIKVAAVLENPMALKREWKHQQWPEYQPRSLKPEPYGIRCFPTYTCDSASCILEIKAWLKSLSAAQGGFDLSDVLAALELVEEQVGNETIELLEIMLDNDCNLGALTTALTEHILSEEQKKAEEEAKAQQQAEGGNGHVPADEQPPYDHAQEWGKFCGM